MTDADASSLADALSLDGTAREQGMALFHALYRHQQFHSANGHGYLPITERTLRFTIQTNGGVSMSAGFL